MGGIGGVTCNSMGLIGPIGMIKKNYIGINLKKKKYLGQLIH
jgi:hypothetical protein